MINFNRQAYSTLLSSIISKYEILNFSKSFDLPVEKLESGGFCCLRHDVDFCIESAYEMAKIEKDMKITSSYFFLVDSDNYNLLSKNSRNLIKEISKLGHEICLHFDISNYSSVDNERIINLHKKCLEDIIDNKVLNISYHTPGKIGLDNLNLSNNFYGLNNTYSKEFNNNFFYASDSLCRFRADNFVDKILSKQYKNIHLLIHPIWWVEDVEQRDQKILNNLDRKKTKLLDDYNQILSEYGISV